MSQNLVGLLLRIYGRKKERNAYSIVVYFPYLLVYGTEHTLIYKHESGCLMTSVETSRVFD